MTTPASNSTPATAANNPPAVPTPGADWQTLVGIGLAAGLNRWIDIETYNRTGGALLPAGSVVPGSVPAVVVNPATTAPSWSGMVPMLAIGALVLFVVLRK